MRKKDLGTSQVWVEEATASDLEINSMNVLQPMVPPWGFPHHLHKLL